MALVSGLFVIILLNVWSAFNDQEKSDNLLSPHISPTLKEFDEGYRDLYQIMTAAKALALGEEVNHYKMEFRNKSEKVEKRLYSPQKLIDLGLISNQNQAEMQALKGNFQRWFTLYKGLFALDSGYDNYYEKHIIGMKALLLRCVSL
ncbi:hypothetical protein [Psychromonas hadalis]|uniref:hypothetical protein n=1 Tax=Psychromonas hadalis TaxID=211669 RepID=UPI0003B397C7|nr:hypothetical protein [Psychromonas hadalis]